LIFHDTGIGTGACGRITSKSVVTQRAGCCINSTVDGMMKGGRQIAYVVYVNLVGLNVMGL